MTEQILLPAEDARRVAELLRDGEGGEADVYADFLREHADEHAFDDRFTDIGPIDEFIDDHA